MTDPGDGEGALAVTEGSEPSEAEAALAELLGVYERAAQAVRTMPEPHAAFTAATRLATATREVSDLAARLRAEIVASIWQSEELSLAALAKRVGISKSRANQLIQAAKGTREE